MPSLVMLVEEMWGANIHIRPVMRDVVARLELCKTTGDQEEEDIEDTGASALGDLSLA